MYWLPHLSQSWIGCRMAWPSPDLVAFYIALSSVSTFTTPPFLSAKFKQHALYPRYTLSTRKPQLVHFPLRNKNKMPTSSCFFSSMIRTKRSAKPDTPTHLCTPPVPVLCLSIQDKDSPPTTF
ncbi:hypothetical protein FPOAC2_11960 [Fusarium poae]